MPPDLNAGAPREIPLIAVGARAAADLCRADPARAQALITDALSSHVLFPLAARLGDRISRSWFARRGNPYLDEIRDVADLLGVPGIFFLNLIYEWACSTSAAPDPSGVGARLIRVLDWGLSGIGRHVVIAHHATPVGPFFSATWPGYAGALTAMAPGRFSAAINQAPRIPIGGSVIIDEAIAHLRMLCRGGTLPAAHLLRQICETAPDFATAVGLLTDKAVDLAVPAIFTVAGIAADEARVIEGIGRERRIHRPDKASGVVGVANDWLSPDLPGQPRVHAASWSKDISPTENNRLRRTAICALQAGAFHGAADLAEPVLNDHTVIVASMNARRGEMSVEALDPPAAGGLPVVVATRRIAAAA
jgi:hypothetical protein